MREILKSVVYLEALDVPSGDVTESFTSLLEYVGDSYPTDASVLAYTTDDYEKLTLKFYCSKQGDDCIQQWIPAVAPEHGFSVVRVETESVSEEEWSDFCEVTCSEEGRFDPVEGEGDNEATEAAKAASFNHNEIRQKHSLPIIPDTWEFMAYDPESVQWNPKVHPKGIAAFAMVNSELEDGEVVEDAFFYVSGRTYGDPGQEIQEQMRITVDYETSPRTFLARASSPDEIEVKDLGTAVQFLKKWGLTLRGPE